MLAGIAIQFLKIKRADKLGSPRPSCTTSYMIIAIAITIAGSLPYNESVLKLVSENKTHIAICAAIATYIQNYACMCC